MHSIHKTNTQPYWCLCFGEDIKYWISKEGHRNFMEPGKQDFSIRALGEQLSRQKLAHKLQAHTQRNSDNKLFNPIDKEFARYFLDTNLVKFNPWTCLIGKVIKHMQSQGLWLKLSKVKLNLCNKISLSLSLKENFSWPLLPQINMFEHGWRSSEGTLSQSELQFFQMSERMDLYILHPTRWGP